VLLGVALLVITALGAALAFALRPAAELPGLAREPAPHVHGLSFVDHREPGAPREVDLVPEPGELLFLYFGYLSCPDVCPMTMSDIAQARDALGEELAARTRVAFVTLDPERDEPERLRSYLTHFFDDAYLALTAPDQDALDAAAQRLGVRYEIEPHAPGAERYEVAHSALTYVIDEHGRVVRELPFGATSDDYARLMRALLQ
jgi:protein SCO1